MAKFAFSRLVISCVLLAFSGIAVASGYSCGAALPVRYGTIPAHFQIEPADVGGRLTVEIDGKSQWLGSVTSVADFRSGTDENQRQFELSLELLASSHALSSSDKRVDSARVFRVKLNDGNDAVFTLGFAGSEVLASALSGGDGIDPLGCIPER